MKTRVFMSAAAREAVARLMHEEEQRGTVVSEKTAREAAESIQRLADERRKSQQVSPEIFMQAVTV